MSETESQRDVLITGIGSLPHPNPDSALEYAFRHSLPFLPQMPRRNRWEYMLPQALEGFPGLQVDSEGSVSLSLSVWKAESQAFSARLQEALPSLSHADSSSSLGAPLESFEPSADASICWRPFLWELNERKSPAAKIQLCGPITAELSLQVSPEEIPTPKLAPEVSAQIVRLIYLRATAMIRAMRAGDPKRQVFLFLDEPGLCALNPENPMDLNRLATLKLLVQALKKEATAVGIHCCSDGPWSRILELQPDYLSIDLQQSLTSLLRFVKPIRTQTVKRSAISPIHLALGLIPTTSSSAPFGHSGFTEALRDLLQPLQEASRSRRRTPLSKNPTLLTTACGLGLLNPKFAEEALSLLVKYADEYPRHLKGLDLLN